MSKPTLAVDIDEVLFPFVQEFVAHHNEKYATTLHPAHFTSYRFEDIIQEINESEAIQRVYEFTTLRHELVEPVQDAQKGVARLSSKFDLVLLTARHPKFQKNTKLWLKQYFPDVFTDLIMIGYEHDDTITPRTKAQVCNEINAFALVDDSLKYITQAVEQGINGILFGNYPWNQADILPQGVIRVDNWIDLAEYFGA